MSKMFNILYIDDAHWMLHERHVGPSLSTLLTQIRAFASMIIAGQIPSMISPIVHGIMGTTIMMSLKPGELGFLAKQHLGLTREQIQVASKLQIAEAIVKESFRFPYLFPIKVLNFDEGEVEASITYDEIKKYMADKIQDLGYKKRVRLGDLRKAKISAKDDNSGPILDSVPKSISGTKNLDEEAFFYLMDVKLHPLLSLTKRDDSLGISYSKGNRIRQKLIKAEKIKTLKFSTGTQGRDITLLEIVNKPILHHAFQKKISKIKRPPGWKVYVEKEYKKAGRVDVLFENPETGHTIAYEIALMSEGYELTNIQKCLKAGIDEVISAARTCEIRDKIKKEVDKLDDPLKSKVKFALLSEFLEK